MRLWPSVVLALCALSCNDELVEDVPPEECVSGKRWVGGKRAHEEMFPGRDCVGCHLENDGPQLMVGGTVYPVRTAEGPLGQEVIDAFGQPQAEDCFGVEGVKVTITGDDGEVFVRYTNRAGNFYIEGRQSELTTPFQVTIDYTEDDGDPIVRPMGTRPAYGGCARCHTPGLSPPAEPCTPSTDPTCVFTAAGDYIDLGQDPLEVAESGGQL